MIGRILLSVTALAMTGSLAVLGQCPNQRTYYPPTYVEPVYVAPAVVLVPAYFAQFTPQPTVAAQQPEEQAGNPQPQAPQPPAKQPEPAPLPQMTIDQKLDKVIELLAKLLSKIEALEQGDGGGPAPASATPAFDPAKAQAVGAILAHSCISCHAQTVSYAKGGGLTLIEQLNGQPTLTQLNKASRKEIVARLTAKTMPPTKATAAAITDAERQTLIDWFNK